MKVEFHTDTLQPMIDWLMACKKTGTRDLDALKSILAMPDYRIEFQRYGMEGLPVCGIRYEEAMDFFMNFDTKDFENPRLQSKKESFLAFFEEIERRVPAISRFASITEEDRIRIETLLKEGLPDEAVSQIDTLTIILIVSIGNSMGWPYGQYIDYDVANLNLFETLDDFLHVTAHEIHHMFLGELLGCEGIRSEDLFLQHLSLIHI